MAFGMKKVMISLFALIHMLIGLEIGMTKKAPVEENFFLEED